MPLSPSDSVRAAEIRLRILFDRIAGLRSRIACAPHAPGREAGMLVTVSTFNAELDAIGEMDAVSCWRLRHENDLQYQHRLAIHLQQQINQREDFANLLDRVLAVRVR